MLNFKALLAFIIFLAASIIGQVNANLTSSAVDIFSFTGADSAKLVFVNSGNLYLVDYTIATPAIQKFTNISGAVCPSISPDGKWVTYMTGVGSDRTNGPAVSWIMPCSIDAVPTKVDTPAFIPRFYAKDDSLFIVYTTVGGDNLYLNSSCKTMKKFISPAGTPASSATEITTGGYWGGLSTDGRYLASGATLAYLKDLSTGDTSRLHVLHEKVRSTDRDTIIRPQVCNTSISQSNRYTDAVLYLDFGNSIRATLPGIGTWGFHQNAFLSRKDGSVYRVFGTPEKTIGSTDGSVAKYEWDCTEWSNHPYFGVAVTNITRRWMDGESWSRADKREEIYIINLKDSAYLSLIKTTDTTRNTQVDLNYPALWLNIPQNFTETTWLDNPIAIERYIPSVNGIRSTFAPFIQNKTLLSNLALESLALLDVNGKEIYRVKLNGCSSFDLVNGSGHGKPIAVGSYYVKVISVGGHVSVLNWKIIK